MSAPAFSILLDAEALPGSAQIRRPMQPWLEYARRSDSALYVSAVTLTEVTDGSARDAKVRRMVNATRVVPVTEAIGYAAGRLRPRVTQGRRKARDLTARAVVAATALTLASPVVVLTGDLTLLLQDTAVRVESFR